MQQQQQMSAEPALGIVKPKSGPDIPEEKLIKIAEDCNESQKSFADAAKEQLKQNAEYYDKQNQVVPEIVKDIKAVMPELKLADAKAVEPVKATTEQSVSLAKTHTGLESHKEGVGSKLGNTEQTTVPEDRRFNMVFVNLPVKNPLQGPVNVPQQMPLVCVPKRIELGIQPPGGKRFCAQCYKKTTIDANGKCPKGHIVSYFLTTVLP